MDNLQNNKIHYLEYVMMYQYQSKIDFCILSMSMRDKNKSLVFGNFQIYYSKIYSPTV